ncbi:MAG: acyl-CoA dehydrogenase family protein [Dehalococcoidales bacterium]
MDLSLSKDEKTLRDNAREFARKRVKPLACEIDRSGEFPGELFKETAAAGYHGLPFPAAYGGGGAGYLGYALVLEQISQASLTVGSILAVNTTPQEAVYRFGSETQRQIMLRPMAVGQEMGCIAFTEAGTGSDPNAISSNAMKKGNRYILNGHKQFVTNAANSRRSLVFTRSEQPGVTAFLIDTAVPGFRVSRPVETMGARGMGVCEVDLDEITVTEENRIGAEGQGYEILLDAISVERLGVALQAVGIAQAALELSLEYARERKAMSQAISRLPTIQWHLAEMVTRIDAGRWLALEAAGERDLGLDIRYRSAVAKLFTSQMAVEVTRMGMQVHGTYGTIQGSDIERLYRDAKMTEIYVGVSEIQRVIIANQLI